MVSRKRPRSRPTMRKPVSASSRAAMLPVHPMPTITTSARGICRAMCGISSAADRHGRNGVGLALELERGRQHRIGAREADHLPRRHVAVAAVEWIAEIALDGVLADHLEEDRGGEAFEVDLAGFELRQHAVLLGGGEVGERLAL